MKNSRDLRRAIGFSVSGAKHYENDYYKNSPGSFGMLSVTGSRCDCRCAHCDGGILHGMMDADTVEKFVGCVDRLEARGCSGILVSGGSDIDGSTPVLSVIDGISYAKKRGLSVIVHTGLVEKKTALALKGAGADQVLMDVIGDADTIRGVYGLSKAPDDYYRSMLYCKEAGLVIAPHLVVGLDFGRVTGEFGAIDMVRAAGAEVFVLVVLSPKRGTVMQDTPPPALDDVLSVFRYASESLAGTSIMLGCMRPRRYSLELEMAAVDLGFAAIAFPHAETIRYAQGLGLRSFFYEQCCSLAERDLQ